MTILRFVAGLLRLAPRGRCVGLALLMVLAAATEGIGMLLLVPLLSAMQGASAATGMAHQLPRLLAALGLPTNTPIPLLLLFCLVLLVRNAIQFGREQLAARLQQGVGERLRTSSFAALLGAQWRWLAGQRTGDHASLILSDVGRAEVGLGHALAMFASAITAALYLLAAFALSWKLALVAMLSGVALLLVGGQRRGVALLGRQLTQANQGLHAGLHDRLSGLRLAKILGAETAYLAAFERTAGIIHAQQLRFARGLSASKAWLQSTGAILLACYVYLGLQVLHMAIAELLVLVAIFARLVPLLTTVQQQRQYCLHAAAAFSAIKRRLQESRTWAEPPLADATPPIQLTTSIALSTVEVQYAGRDTPALQGLSLRLPARTTTAVVGASGAGKSTLADVLSGLLSPDQGTLEIDGVVLDAAARRAWRRSVAYVSQDAFLLNDSVRNNLLIACPDASEQALHAALDQAAAQFVHALPQGWDTPVGEGGMPLSGGERQRLALARALLQRPALLILDEATSALDHDNEASIRSAIQRLHGDLTVLLIGHRLALLEQADSVLVLDQGRLVAQGPWQAVAPVWSGAR
ncbi:ABC transporter ATP-binding protein [Xanthomonas floridensis]|uniref:Transporter n=1 Tax=Xanthomonas floridensis TaxID=1843580 RepID=A0A1A9MAQ4_9XANT|nr:ABC transporter ATP-binding protein [Xanthomonas floridensis]MEA5125698.1 ABC transporter ATP-binding protein [Xanthomonas floridensis]MEA5133573.1 ABC transporter ATP-binding protein [Xanthomonas floridensis]OAG66717.1 transporter [Xanthomonas floridensis]